LGARTTNGRASALHNTGGNVMDRKITFDVGSVAANTHALILEAALACIARECELAMQTPEVMFTTVCRISSVTRQALSPARTASTKATSA
jgi:hypothetical protein